LPENQFIRNFNFAGQPGKSGNASFLTVFISYIDINNFLSVSTIMTGMAQILKYLLTKE